MKQLTLDEFNLLKQIVERRNILKLSLVNLLGRQNLTEDEREDLRGILLEEMLSDGLDPCDEANEYGRTIDQLIGKIGSY